MVSARLRPNPVASVSADHLDLLVPGFDEANNGGPPEIAVRVDSSARARRQTRRPDCGRVGDPIGSRGAVRRGGAHAPAGSSRSPASTSLAAQALRALVADTLRTYEGLVRVNKARVVAGSIPGSKPRGRKSRCCSSERPSFEPISTLAKATAQLRTLLGRPPESPLEIADALAIAGGEPAADDVAGVESLALRSRPDLLALQLDAGALARGPPTAGGARPRGLHRRRRVPAPAGRLRPIELAGVLLQHAASAPESQPGRDCAGGCRAGSGQPADCGPPRAGDCRRRAARITTTRSRASSWPESSATCSRQPDERATSPPIPTRRGGGTLLELLDAQRAFNETMQTYVDAQANLRRAIARLNAAARNRGGAMTCPASWSTPVLLVCVVLARQRMSRPRRDVRRLPTQRSPTHPRDRARSRSTRKC